MTNSVGEFFGTNILMQKCDPKFLSSKVFDNYEFISAVGSGAFGRVLRAKHRCGGQMRACKARFLPCFLLGGARRQRTKGHWVDFG